MSGDSHMHDLEGHVKAVEADLEYYRCKRLESRMLHLVRRGVVPFAALLRAQEEITRRPAPVVQQDGGGSLEARVRRLEDRLDDFVRGIAATRARRPQDVIEDNRTERGDYDPFFRLTKRHFSGSVDERVDQLEQALEDSELVLSAYAEALVLTGQVTHEELADNARRLAGLGHHNGARIVARAWTDEDFKQRLLSEGRPAVRELDIPPGRLGVLGIAENTPDVHNVVVCTLCSCYPTDLLGSAPWWYRTEEYRRRIVEAPRRTLADMFDFEVPEAMTLRVHDSTSDVRWMVLPTRPAGTEGMSEEELAELVTPESLVGTAPALSPSARHEPDTTPAS
jgi:nitrile hydratase